MRIFRLVLLIIHIVVVLLLTGTLLNSIIPPKVFPWFNFLSLVFPILILIHLSLCLFWIISWKKRAFVFLFLTLFFLNGIKRWVNYSTPKTGQADFKVLTYNSHGGKGEGKTEEISKYLKEQNADVIFLQESGIGDKYDLDNYKWTSVQKVITTYTKHKIVHEEDILNDRRTSYAKLTDIEINGKIVRFVNVYLEPYRLAKSMVKPTGDTNENEQKAKIVIKQMIPIFKNHQEQVSEILAGIKDSPYPVVIMGDFNSVPNSYEYYQMTKDYQDVFMEVGKGFSTSFHDYKYPLRIDYIYASEKGLTPLSYQVNRSIHLSDHFPVMAEFSFKN